MSSAEASGICPGTLSPIVKARHPWGVGGTCTGRKAPLPTSCRWVWLSQRTRLAAGVPFTCSEAPFPQSIQQGHAHPLSPRQTANSERTEKVSHSIRCPPAADPGREVEGHPVAGSGYDLHLGAQNWSPGTLHGRGAICSHPCSPVSETQHLLSRIRTYSPLGRHPDKSYILLGFSVFSLLLRHQKLPSLQASSCYLFQDDGLADISYSSSLLRSLKKILGRSGPPKSKSQNASSTNSDVLSKGVYWTSVAFLGARKRQAWEPSVLGLWANCSSLGSHFCEGSEPCSASSGVILSGDN